MRLTENTSYVRNAKEKLPALLKNQAQIMELSAQLRQYIQLAESDELRKEQNERRQQLRDVFANVKRKRTPEEERTGKVPADVQVLRPRIKQRINSAVSTISSADPLFRALDVDGVTPNDQYQEILRQAQVNIDMSSIWRSVMEMALVEMSAIVYTMPYIEDDGIDEATHTGKFVGPLPKCISPRHFIAYPLTYGQLNSTRIHGHMFDMQDWEIERHREIGIYLPESIGGPVVAGETVSDTNRIFGSEATQATHPINSVRCYSLIFNYIPSGKRTPVRLLVTCTSSGAILSVEDWPHSLSPYTIIEMEPNPDALLASNGAANDIVSEQFVINDLLTKVLHGVRWATEPALKGPPKPVKDTEGLVPGGYYPTMLPEQVDVVALNPNLQPAIQVIQLLMAFAESSSSTSSTVTGGGGFARGDSTATEENIKYQGFQLASSGDISGASRGMTQVAKAMLYWIRVLWDEWKAN